jgi:hypothetical protein
VFTEYQGNRVNIDASSQPDLRNNLFFGHAGGNGTGYGGAFCPTADNPILDPLLRGINRTNIGRLDPRPQSGSPVFANVRSTPADDFYHCAEYKGAFDGSDLWLRNWTALDKNGFLPAKTNIVDVSGYLTGTNNWVHTNVYVLTGYTYVMSNAVLNIEPGTVIKGRDNAGFNDGALFVTRGGKVNAIGRAHHPVIFTAEDDDVNDPDDLPVSGAGSRGLWGGVVMLGNARINNTVNAPQVAPYYDIYEGLPDTDVGGQRIHRFGGTNDDDSSGVLRYVSIRHGGKVLETAKELNGLTLGGVGRGTTIEFVEAYLIADDGFEFFGGSVNTRYLVSALVDDDAFDTDQGFNGKNQFWFALQGADARDEGGEINGQPNAPTVVISNSLPLCNFEVYNATFIGAGTTGSGNDSLNIRVQNFSKWYNCVFTEYQGNRVNIDASSQPDLRNNLFFGHAGGNGTGYGGAFCPAADNPILDPLLRGISRLANFGLDPRPGAASPVYNDVRATPVTGVYVPTVYKGAFNGANWAYDWTALGANNIFKPAPSPVVPDLPPVKLDINAAGGSAVLSWGSAAGLGYRVLSTTNVAGAYTNEAALTGNGGTLNFTNPIAGPDKFFKVRVK